MWSNPGNPTDAVARALGTELQRFSRALHKIKAANDLSGAGRVVIDSNNRSPRSGARRSETSTTKTEAGADGKAFVTLRFVGDDLDPDEISAILPVEPTRAHRKGEEFFAGAAAL